MTPEQWHQLRDLLEAALDRQAEEREEFLRTACPDDELRREVVELLAVEDAAEGFLETPAFDLHGEPDGHPRPEPGQVIGRYRVITEVGRGGAGAVYLAERADGDFEQRVALKVLKRGTDTDEVVARFRAERQILAHLEQPNIARLIDGGTTDDGLPYLVMEHVEGMPIDDYCAAHRLPIRERLRLVRTVCAAVQFAHQNLVVHRDLKPTNILVTADGVPKLLDFGIAKLLDPEAGASGETRLGLHRYTPEYAAPEQVVGGPITTATDVYGLGAVLYELLTGRPPHGPRRRVRAAAGRLVEDGTITRPSTAAHRTHRRTRGQPEASSRPSGTSPAQARAPIADPKRLRRALAGDLDNIVLKALAPEPERRYPSAAELSEDLRRHLEGLPVRARGDSYAYRAGRFLRRHRIAATAAGLIVALLLGFAVRETSLRRQAQHARGEAEDAREQAVAIQDFLVGSLEQADPTHSSGQDVTVREMLDGAVARIRANTEMAPLMRAELLDAMGRSYLGLGLYDRAQPLLDEALELRRKALDEDHLQVAESHYRLFHLYHERGDLRAAEAHLREAMAIRQRRGETDHLNYAKQLSGLAQLLLSRGEYDEAERLHLEVLAIKRRLLGDRDPEVATTLHNLAVVLLERGDPGRAVQLFRQAFDIRRQHFEEPDKHLASTLNGLGVALEAAGETEAAERNYQAALSMRRRLYPDGHGSLAVSLNNLGTFYLRRGDSEAAEPLLREALALQDRLLEPDHPERATVLRNLADLLLVRGQTAAAEPLAREALDVFESRLEPGHWRIADAKSVLGGVLAARGRDDLAEPLLVEGASGLLENGGPDSRYAREAQARLDRFYSERNGRPAEADRP